MAPLSQGCRGPRLSICQKNLEQSILAGLGQCPLPFPTVAPPPACFWAAVVCRLSSFRPAFHGGVFHVRTTKRIG